MISKLIFDYFFLVSTIYIYVYIVLCFENVYKTKFTKIQNIFNFLVWLLDEDQLFSEFLWEIFNFIIIYKKYIFMLIIDTFLIFYYNTYGIYILKAF